MQRESIVTDEWRARTLAARLKFAAVCKKAGAGSPAPKPEDNPLSKAVDRLIASVTATRDVKTAEMLERFEATFMKRRTFCKAR